MSKTYDCTVLVDASRGFTVEADSPNDAALKAEELLAEQGFTVCHQCSRRLDIGDIEGVLVYADDQEVLDTTFQATELTEARSERDTLAQVLADAGKVAHLYHSGAGMLEWINGECKRLGVDLNKRLVK